MSEKIFNSQRYEDELTVSNLIDGTDALANRGLVIGFHHVPSETEVYFKAFITAFNESYSSEWASESVYGRVDPIYMFKNTKRSVTLAFKVPCSTVGEGYDNLAKVQTLLQFLYPSYADVNSATTITQSPLVRIQLMNLLSKVEPGGGSSETNARQLAASYTSTSDASAGLLGVINNLAVNHNLENPEIGVIEKDASTILPKMIEINLDFGVIHEEDLGWKGNSFMSKLFPYNAQQMTPEVWDIPFTLPADQSGLSGEFTNSEDYGAPSNTGYPENIKENEDGFLYVAPGSEEDGEAADPPVSDQDIANAEARYSGLFGNARFNSDLKQYSQQDANDYQKSALRGAYSIGPARRGSADASDAAYTIRKGAGGWADDYGE